MIFFLDDWISPEAWGRDWRESGVIRQAVKPDTLIPHVATDDVGRVAAWAFEHPEKSIGRVWELVGELMTYPAIGQTLLNLCNRPMRFEELPESEADALDRIVAVGACTGEVRSLEQEFGFRMTTLEEYVDRILDERRPL